jgi:hypothetical protein
MKQWITTFLALGILTAAFFFLMGCDKANEPDVPLRPYHLINSMMTDGTAEDVKVAGNYIAVANGTFGAFVLDKNRLDSLQVLLNYEPSGLTGARVHFVAIDVVHSYLSVYRDPGDDVHYGVFDITKAGTPNQEVHFNANFSSNVNEYNVSATRDTVVWWCTDYTPSDRHLATTGMARADSTSPWQNLTATCPEHQPLHGLPRGFGMRSDGMIAVANDDAGIFIDDSRTCQHHGVVDFSGIAYGCAWYGNYIVVAANYLTVIVDATDLSHPQVISSLTIPTADRLRKVAIDGTYACVLDEYDGVYVIDISNPRNPQYVQLLNFYDGTAVAADNGKLFCTAGGLGLLIYSR